MVESQMSHVVNAIHLSFSQGSFQKKQQKNNNKKLQINLSIEDNHCVNKIHQLYEKLFRFINNIF